ncbi:periplasmic binding protein [Paenibacillus sp. JCM 10914]|nr:periplasmic binding protein [Paenibacillus sp. JCM 10914]
MNTTKRSQLHMCLVLILLTIIIGCGAGTSPITHSEAEPTRANPASVQDTLDTYPLNLNVNGTSITIPARPERIAALSLDAAEVVLELTNPERVVVVPKSIENHSLAFRTEEGQQVQHKIAGATSLDPEQILSYEADLLIMTKLHDKEKEATEILEQSGVPIITLESWSTLDAIMNNILTIGTAIGEEEKATSIVEDMKDRLSKINSTLHGVDKPNVLVVSPLGPGTGPYLLGSSNISYDLVRRAGAEHAADNLGLTRATKATIEQVIKADPDNILLIEWQEGITDDIDEIVQTPGWSTLQAVQNERVLHMPARKLLNPNRYTIDTLEELARWLHPGQF